MGSFGCPSNFARRASYCARSFAFRSDSAKSARRFSSAATSSEVAVRMISEPQKKASSPHFAINLVSPVA